MRTNNWEREAECAMSSREVDFKLVKGLKRFDMLS